MVGIRRRGSLRLVDLLGHRLGRGLEQAVGRGRREGAPHDAVGLLLVRQPVLRELVAGLLLGVVLGPLPERQDGLLRLVHDLLAELDGLGQDDLLLGVEERHLADLLEVHPDRVVDADHVRGERVELLLGGLVLLLGVELGGRLLPGLAVGLGDGDVDAQLRGQAVVVGGLVIVVRVLARSAQLLVDVAALAALEHGCDEQLVGGVGGGHGCPPVARGGRWVGCVVVGRAARCRATAVELQALALERQDVLLEPVPGGVVARATSASAARARLNSSSSRSRARSRVSRLWSSAWCERLLGRLAVDRSSEYSVRATVVGGRLQDSPERRPIERRGCRQAGAPRQLPGGRRREQLGRRAGPAALAMSSGWVSSSRRSVASAGSRACSTALGSSAPGLGQHGLEVDLGARVGAVVARRTPALEPAERLQQRPARRRRAARQQLQVAVATDRIGDGAQGGQDRVDDALVGRAPYAGHRSRSAAWSMRNSMIGWGCSVRSRQVSGSSRMTSSGSLPSGRRTTSTSVRRPCARCARSRPRARSAPWPRTWPRPGPPRPRHRPARCVARSA